MTGAAFISPFLADPSTVEDGLDPLVVNALMSDPDGAALVQALIADGRSPTTAVRMAVAIVLRGDQLPLVGRVS